MASSLGVSARTTAMSADRARAGMELLNASIRAKTRPVKGDVGTSKERRRLRRLRDSK